MTIKYNLKADVDKAIETAITSVNRGRANVQKAAILVLVHAAKHGDYTKANDLVTGLGNSINSAALVSFFVKFGGLVVDEENECFKDWSGKRHIHEHLDEAKDTMWWTLKKTNAFKGFSLQGQIGSLLASYNKAIKKQAKLVAEGNKDVAEVDADNDVIRLLASISKGSSLEQAVHTVFDVVEEEPSVDDLMTEIKGIESTLDAKVA